MAVSRKKDMRHVNEVSWHENRLGEFFVFAEVGTGKDSLVVTLAHRKTKAGIITAFKKYKRYLGKPISDVPRKD